MTRWLTVTLKSDAKIKSDNQVASLLEFLALRSLQVDRIVSQQNDQVVLCISTQLPPEEVEQVAEDHSEVEVAYAN